MASPIRWTAVEVMAIGWFCTRSRHILSWIFSSSSWLDSPVQVFRLLTFVRVELKLFTVIFGISCQHTSHLLCCFKSCAVNAFSQIEPTNSLKKFFIHDKVKILVSTILILVFIIIPIFIVVTRIVMLKDRCLPIFFKPKANRFWPNRTTTVLQLYTKSANKGTFPVGCFFLQRISACKL